MIVAARDFDGIGNSYVLAIRLLPTPSLYWKVPLNPAIVPAGQFPIVGDGTNTRVVFSGYGPGVRFVGAQ